MRKTGESMNHPDLFGGETLVKPKPTLTKISEWIRIARYRKAEKGADKQCGNCVHIRRFRQSKTWYKCDLFIAGGPATDIRVHHVCNKWEKE